jgi:hypothetical protein
MIRKPPEVFGFGGSQRREWCSGGHETFHFPQPRPVLYKLLRNNEIRVSQNALAGRRALRCRDLFAHCGYVCSALDCARKAIALDEQAQSVDWLDL